MVKTNKGRQKIEMKKMAKASNLQVTFSKRRFGLFKKASELCTLTGAEVLIIVFSPGGKVFSFGHPNVHDMIYRFSNNNNSSLFFNHNNLQLSTAGPSEYIQQLNRELTELLEIQERERNAKKFLKSFRENKEKDKIWYEKDVEKLHPSETNYLISILEGITKNLASEISHYPPINFYQNNLGESSGNITQEFIGNGINESALDVFDQRRMLNLNVFTNNQNYLSSVGSYTNGMSIPGNHMNFVSSYNINENNES